MIFVGQIEGLGETAIGGLDDVGGNEGQALGKARLESKCAL